MKKQHRLMLAFAPKNHTELFAIFAGAIQTGKRQMEFIFALLVKVSVEIQHGHHGTNYPLPCALSAVEFVTT